MATALGEGSRASVPTAKVQVPRVPRRVISRDRLLTSFAGRLGRAGPVALVCAPAGSGKTVFLADWAQHAMSEGMHVAWVSLDNADNDPYVLWSAILLALEASGAYDDEDGTRAAQLRQLSPPHKEVERGFVVAVLDVLDTVPEGLTLVLDDVHELREEPALEGLELLLRNKPERLQIVLVTRTEPPLGLHRLRLDDDLVEVDRQELAFTTDEAEAMLVAHDVDLSSPDLMVLMDRTEGWVAGLRIAAASLAVSGDPAEVLRSFHGDDRVLSDYLVAEVLGRQPQDLQDFLFATCAPERLTWDLARILSGRADAGSVLDDLERRNSLIVRLGQRDAWYRYHALLRGYLQAEAARRDPDALRLQQAKTALWHSDHGAPDAALTHAAASDDPALLTRLLDRHGLHLILSGQGATLRRLVAEQPPGMRDQGMELLLALATLDSGDAASADSSLVTLGSDPFPEDARRRLLHAVAILQRALLGGDVPAALERLTASYPGPTGDLDLDLLALSTRGPARVRGGDYQGAITDHEVALSLAREAGHDELVLMLLSRLGGAAAALADFPDMRRWSKEAIDFATSRGWARSPRVAYAYLVAAWTAFQTCDAEASKHWSALGLEVVEGIPDLGIEVGVLSMAAVADFEEGHDRREAFERLRRIWSIPEAAQMSPALLAFAAPQELRMAVTLGEYGKATEVVERVSAILGDCAETRTLRATLHGRLRRRGAARQVLGPVLRGESRVHVRSTLATSWLLEASIAAAEGEASRAHDALEIALSWTAPNGATRPFVDAPANVRAQLATAAGRFGRADPFVETVLRTIPPVAEESAMESPHAGAGAAHETLTARELELLHDLPSLMSIEEIAAARSITLNTVKSHLRALYRKLGASSRREAVAQARHRGLL